MDFELRISPKAIDEIENAFQYYLTISEKVAYEFNDELAEILDRLELNPYFQIRYKEIRAIPLRVFPFLVFFSIENKIIYIHSVFHTSQNPEKYPHK